MMRLQMRLAVFAVLAAAVWSAGRTELRGAEPAQKFLAALREADYFDTALEYLDQLATSPLTPANLKEILSYERGATLVAGAKHQRDFTLREKQLDEAQKALDEFVAQQPSHPLTFSARSELGNLLVERGRLKMERGKKVTDKPGKDALAKEAYALYVKSAEIYESLEGELKKKLDGYPKAIDEKKDAKLYEQREQARADYLQTQLLSVAVKEETADTLDKASKEYKDVLTNAAKEYGEIYNKYRSRLAGMYARMYQGRCHQKVGNFKEALSYYDELLQNQDEPRELHTLKTKVLLLAVDCWMAESQKKYAEVIDKGGKWLDKAYPDEIRSPDMMALRLAVARSSKSFADQLKKDKPKDPQINQLMTEARKLSQYVAKFPSEYQKEAQKLAGELGIGGPSTSGDAPQPKTFADARTAGKDVLDGVQVAKVKLEGLPPRIRDEQSAEVKKQLQDELKEAQDLIKSGDAEALRLFQLAQRLAVNDTPPEDLNVVRYFICYLFYSMQDFENAAVMGEFVAQRFPESGGARQCAKIAMASYLKQYANAKTDCKPLVDQILGDFDKDKDGKLTAAEIEGAPAAKQAELKAADVDGNGKIETAEIVRMFTRYESEHIVEICNYITSKWPDQPEAQEALATLISFMITENQLDKAQAYLEKIPEESK
ncbi:MAG TPA: hypothetical protein PLV92_06715, partial [Pirellulaceae bacterium]|nr:hypothetical protein [Pirellulaceae bacterium]